MVKSRTKKEPLLNTWNMLIGIIITSATFIGSIALNTYSFVSKMAPKEYVDQMGVNLQKYTDRAAAATLQQAFEHSDANRAAMNLDMKTYSSDLKSQGVKIDLMLESVKQIQADIYSQRARVQGQSPRRSQD